MYWIIKWNKTPPRHLKIFKKHKELSDIYNHSYNTTHCLYFVKSMSWVCSNLVDTSGRVGLQCESVLIEWDHSADICRSATSGKQPMLKNLFQRDETFFINFKPFGNSSVTQQPWQSLTQCQVLCILKRSQLRKLKWKHTFWVD